MNTHTKFAVATGIALLAAGAMHPVAAQSTDGYHSIQVFPGVVDSSTFSQRFTFRNPDENSAVTITPMFYPGTGTPQTTALSCLPIVIPANGQTVVTSLRALCPALVAGNAFGYLYLSENTGGSRPFAAFSRVSNAAGAGFSVEAFPAHTFTSADSVVTGLRRSIATPTAPSFQTNCFIGNLNVVSPSAVTVATDIFYTLYDAGGTQIGNTTSIALTPGKLTRLLDVFSTAGAPASDFVDARIEFEEIGEGEPGLITFCTVQDNTSFGADFRIGKQEEGFSTEYSSIGAQDDHVSRDSIVTADTLMSGQAAPRPFMIPIGGGSNTHVMYFRHPDRVQCEIVDPFTWERVLPAYGLELRMLDQDGATVAGGNEVYGFGEVYLGDKDDRNNGANTRYTIEVESTGANSTALLPYGLHCKSGSGHSVADIVRYNEAAIRF